MTTLEKWAERILKYIFLFIVLITVGIVILAYDHTYFFAKGLTIAADIRQIPLAILVCSMLTASIYVVKSIHHVRDRASVFTYGGGYPLLMGCSLALLAVQCFVSYHAYFMSAGDDVYYVLHSALGYSYGVAEWIEQQYLSLYPNNIMLAGIYGWIRKMLMMVLGIEPGLERFRLILIFLQCVINVLTGVLLYRTAKRLHFCTGMAWAAWGCYLILIGCSPYFLVPYSDSTILFLPLLILELYAHVDCGRKGICLYALIGVLAGLSYLIKPQAFVVVIAIMLVELLRCLATRRIRIGLVALVCSTLFIIGPFFNALANDMEIDLSENKSLGITHYWNMGLNWEREGGFSDEDRAMALQQPTVKERDAYCINSALNRIRSYGLSGMVTHSIRKCLANFADGAFAWGTVFDQVELPLKDPMVTPMIRSIVYENGEHYHVLKTIQQGCWLMVLMLMPWAALGVQKKAQSVRRQHWVIMLSVMGIIAFNMLFEAKARYVYIMVPLLILTAMSGMQELLDRIKGQA